jgi:cyclohexyl-isocyanide hydratase
MAAHDAGGDGGASFTVAIVLYPGCDLLDVAGPNEIFTFFSGLPAGQGLRLITVGASTAAIPVVGALSVVPQYDFAGAPKIDLLFVPGSGEEVAEAINDIALLDFVARTAEGCRYVASVCTGALILASAGLLDGYQATTHWAVIDALRLFPHVRVVNGCPRCVIDGKRVSGGGISSSIDESLFLIQLLATDFTGSQAEGEAAARAVQLMIQYHPQPPFQGGDPCSVDYATFEPVDASMEGFRNSVVAAVKQRVAKSDIGGPQRESKS